MPVQLADYDKVFAIVQFLDTDKNGFMEPSEVKVLIAKISGVDERAIPEDHPDVLMLSNISTYDLTDRLHRNTDADLIDTYFDLLGLGEKTENTWTEDLLARFKKSFESFHEQEVVRMASRLGLKPGQVVQIFNEFDQDGSGTIETGEIQTMMAGLGIFWNKEQAESCAAAMDANGDGTVDQKEFMQWFVSNNSIYMSSKDEGFSRNALLGKLWARRAGKIIKETAAKDKGHLCKNHFGIKVGEFADGPRSSLKVFTGPSEAAQTDAMPEGAHLMLYVDFPLNEGAGEEDIGFLQDTLETLWNKFVEPLLGNLELPKIPMMNAAKPYHSHTFAKVHDGTEEVLRLAIYSEIDPEGLLADSNIDWHSMISNSAIELAFGAKLSDWWNSTDEETATFGEMMKFALSVDINFNTVFVQAFAACLKDPMVLSVLPVLLFINDCRDAEQRLASIIGPVMFSAIFKKSTYKVDFEFADLAEFLDRCITDVFPAVYKDGQQFYKERNALMRANFKVFQKACEDGTLAAIHHAFGQWKPAELYQLWHIANTSGGFVVPTEDPSGIPIEPITNAKATTEMMCGDAAALELPGVGYTVLAGLWCFLKLAFKSGDEIPQENKEMWEQFSMAVKTYFAAQRSLRGFRGVGIVSKISHMGFTTKGLDFFQLLSSEQQFKDAFVLEDDGEAIADTVLSQPCLKAINHYLKSSDPVHRLMLSLLTISDEEYNAMFDNFCPPLEKIDLAAARANTPSVEECKAIFKDMPTFHKLIASIKPIWDKLFTLALDEAKDLDEDLYMMKSENFKHFMAVLETVCTAAS